MLSERGTTSDAIQREKLGRYCPTDKSRSSFPYILQLKPIYIYLYIQSVYILYITQVALCSKTHDFVLWKDQSPQNGTKEASLKYVRKVLSHFAVRQTPAVT